MLLQEISDCTEVQEEKKLLSDKVRMFFQQELILMCDDDDGEIHTYSSNREILTMQYFIRAARISRLID